MKNDIPARSSMSILSCFEQQCHRFPNNVAIAYQDTMISYLSLHDKVAEFSRVLISKGVKKGDIVGFSMTRTPNTIIVILAILKCGAAYMPLDDDSPDEVKVYCLGAANVNILILETETRSIPEGYTGDTITVGDSLPTVSSCIDTKVELESNDKAYVMFTSGTTGNPKGVVIPHRAVIRLVKNTNYVDIKPSDKVIQLSPLSFDASTFEIWAPLLNGGTVVLYPGSVFDPGLLTKTLSEQRVSIMWLTAALFHIIASRYIDLLKDIKILLAGGDVLFPNIVTKVLDEIEGITLINGYGPTENTTFTCCHRMTISNKPIGSIPIGTPITGTNIHVLDQSRKPVAKGEVGELYTSGLGVALGYINAVDDNNSSSFFIDENIADGLIYRTGDLVSENGDGTIEFIGRADNQVKVRGHRMCLEKIQNSILSLNLINEVVVIVDNNTVGDQKLVAFLKCEDGANVNYSYIKKQLSSKLPKYMIPDQIFTDIEFPITKNGKVDKSKISQLAIEKRSAKC